MTIKGHNNLIKNQLFYSNYGFALYSNFTFFLRDSINGDQIRQRERRNLFGYNGSYTNEMKVGKTHFTTTLGAQYRQDITGGKNGATPTELSYTRNRTETLERAKYGNINEINAAL